LGRQTDDQQLVRINRFDSDRERTRVSMMPHAIEILEWRELFDDDDSLLIGIVPDGEESTLLLDEINDLGLDADDDKFMVINQSVIVDGQVFEKNGRRFRVSIEKNGRRFLVSIREIAGDI
jgi:hypothetical protein